MVVEQIALDEAGQSVIEFLMLLPMLVGLTVLLVRINTAIQISIVDQQYGRAQTLFLTSNSPFYPSLGLQAGLIRDRTHQMVVGVSENPAPLGGKYVPFASTQLIARSKKARASDVAKEEPALRANVRIRNSVTLCTQSLFIESGKGGIQPILSLTPDLLHGAAPSPLGEETRFRNYCKGNLTYEQ